MSESPAYDSCHAKLESCMKAFHPSFQKHFLQFWTDLFFVIFYGISEAEMRTENQSEKSWRRIFNFVHFIYFVTAFTSFQNIFMKNKFDDKYYYYSIILVFEDIL